VRKPFLPPAAGVAVIVRVVVWHITIAVQRSAAATSRSLSRSARFFASAVFRLNFGKALMLMMVMPCFRASSAADAAASRR